MLIAALIAITALQAPAGDSVVYIVAPASRLEVTTTKSGLLGFAGHEHTIRARAFTGRIVYRQDLVSASRVEITVLTDSLEVLTPPDTEEIRRVTESMRTEVLDVAHYPEIRLVSHQIEGTSGRLTMTAALTIKGQTREVPLTVDLGIGRDTLRASSSFRIKQTDFGIRPFRGGPGGMVRVADQVTFSINLVGVVTRP
ncbi:MAG TPA: YceI family protein [Gemmatimonadales bacterium]|nr:YceI family protein [Gemmatimonadales bacterium]